jgi:hypothetical protein
MGTNFSVDSVQHKLEAVTRKWWLYPLLLLLFFLRTYASQGYAPSDSIDVIVQVLSHPLIFAFPILMPMAKAITLTLIIGVAILGNRMRRAFNGYVALLYVALAVFQTTAITEAYGFVVICGNLALVLVVALSWMWEVIAERNDFAPRKQPLWKWWVVPLAILSFLAPVDASAPVPDFSLMRLPTNESGLTYCMMTPVVLAVLTTFHPTVNLALLRVSGFVGILFGVVNVLIWFFVNPWGWWMGVLHIPLLAISIYAFVIAIRTAGQA